MSLYRLIAGFIARHWTAYASSAAMLAAIALLIVWVPRQVGHLVDGLVAGQLGGAALAAQLGLLVGAGVVIYLLRVAWRLKLFAAAYRLGVELRVQLYRRLTAQGPQFFQRSRTGDLMARATNDVDAVEMTAGEAFLAGFDGTLTLVVVVGMMTLGVDWRLAAVALLPFPLMALAFFFISRRVHEGWRASLTRFSDLNDHVQETLAGVRTLRALGLQRQVEGEFAQRVERAAAASFDAQRWEAAYEPAVGLTLVAANLLTLAVGGALVWQGELTIGQLTSFTIYLGQLIWPMFAAGWVLSLIERGKAAWTRLQPVLDEPPSIADTGTVAMIESGAIRVDALGFTYPGQSAPALSEVAFELPAGQTLGVVGPTGSGKSTLIHLLLRHYEPAQGVIRWSGRPLPDYTLAALYGAVSWVPQEAVLFSASIADNIALARPDAMRAQIEQAARLAALHEDIERLPAGYDTRVGERGVTLSGGQRQRVAIARALLAEAPLLLLDDALSAVDTGTETAILQHLREARRDRAAIVVSHRLSAVADADSIVVLKAGRIVERGTHEQLLVADGWYAAQWRYQQLEASFDAD
ncbi:MAG: ATP-binding cassette domain-containing protein [Burkholderiales bacterium]|jgi:ATP-binding cassette subfamily B protein/ATP-binding cassette subfamily C protein/ATP-binding cassette subfamily B multidrug efflux pump|nr:ATP-binding cassette domain-containing protein [Burkholderiales bacterium]